MDIIHAPSFFCFCTCPLSQWLIRAAQGCKRAKQRLCAAEKRRALGRQDIRWPFPPTEGRPPGKLSPPQACCACPFSAHRRPVSKRLGRQGLSDTPMKRMVLPSMRGEERFARKKARQRHHAENQKAIVVESQPRPLLLWENAAGFAGRYSYFLPILRWSGVDHVPSASSQHRFAFRFICRPTAAFPHCL